MDTLAKTIEMCGGVPPLIAQHVASIYVGYDICRIDDESFTIRHNQHLRPDFILWAARWNMPTVET